MSISDHYLVVVIVIIKGGWERVKMREREVEVVWVERLKEEEKRKINIRGVREVEEGNRKWGGGDGRGLE